MMKQLYLKMRLIIYYKNYKNSNKKLLKIKNYNRKNRE